MMFPLKFSPDGIHVGKRTVSRAFIASGIKYIVVGVSTFILDFVLNWLLIDIVGINYLLVGYVTSPFVLLFNFLMHKRWSFKDVDNRGTKTRQQMVRYITLVLFNTVANMGLMYLFYGLLEFPLIFARVACVGVGMMWNFPVFRFWVYK